MFDLDLALARIAESYRGYLTTEDCGRAGVSESARKRRLDAGLLLRRHEGVYRYTGHPPTFEGELLAATMAAGPLAAASGPSAMRLFGIRGEWSEVPEITVLGTDLPLLDGVRVRRIDRLAPLDLQRRHGIPVLAPPVALLLLGAVEPAFTVTSAVHDMVFQRFTTRARLIDALVRYGGRGRRGVVAFRRAVRTLDPDGRATQTNLELRLLGLLRGAGVGEPSLQHLVVDDDEAKHRLDFAWPDAMVDVETDGDRWHLAPADRARDRRRDAALRTCGWEVHRFGSDDVELHPSKTVATIMRSLSSRAR